MRLRKILSLILLLRIDPFLSLIYAEKGEKGTATESRVELLTKRCKRGATPLEEYRRAQQEFSTICEHNLDIPDTMFDDITIADVRNFFLVLIVSAHAIFIGNETLKDKMLAKLNERENLKNLPLLLEGFQSVFCDSNNKERLSDIAIVAHRFEVIIVLRLLYSALKSKPKIPNYEKIKYIYQSYNRQMRAYHEGV